MKTTRNIAAIGAVLIATTPKQRRFLLTKVAVAAMAFGQATLVVILGSGCGGGGDASRADPSAPVAQQPLPPTAQAQLAAVPQARLAYTFRPATDFLNGVGRSEQNGAVSARWKDSGAGMLLSGPVVDDKDGVSLPGGVYTWVVRAQRGGDPSHMPSTRVMTVTLRDFTTGEDLTARTLYASDLAESPTELTLQHSTVRREGHRFGVVIHWHDYVTATVHEIRVEQELNITGASIPQRVAEAEAMLRQRFLIRPPGVPSGGLVVALHGQTPSERGDAFTWTAIYALGLAFQARARPGDAVATAKLEEAMRSLHHVIALTGEPGVLPRFVRSDGSWAVPNHCAKVWHGGGPRLAPDGNAACLPETAACVQDSKKRWYPQCPDGKPAFDTWSQSLISEDPYTAYSALMAIAYPLLKDPTVREQVRADMVVIAEHFLKNDFRIVKRGKLDIKDTVVNQNPYFVESDLRPQIQALLANRNVGQQLRDALALLNKKQATYNFLERSWGPGTVFLPYLGLSIVGLGPVGATLSAALLSCGLNPPKMPALPSALGALADALDSGDEEKVLAVLPRALTEIRQAAKQFRLFAGELSRQALKAVECRGRLPDHSDRGAEFRDLIRFTDTEFLPAIDALLALLPAQVNSLKDLKLLASNGAQAALLLNAARIVAPERFDGAYYEALLGEEKSLLGSMEAFYGVDSKVQSLLQGDLGVDLADDRSWRSMTALFVLAMTEARPAIRKRYVALFDRGYAQVQDEHNPLYESMRAALARYVSPNFPVDEGMVAFQLSQMRSVKRGQPKSTWAWLGQELALRSGGLVSFDESQRVGFTRDPLPLSAIVNDHIFLPQRNPRKFGPTDLSDGGEAPAIDLILAGSVAEFAKLNLTLPGTAAPPALVPSRLVATSGPLSSTIGRATGFKDDCKFQEGYVVAPAEFGTLPGPHGTFSVGGNGARLANGVVTVVVDEHLGDWTLQVTVAPTHVYYMGRTCRHAGIEREGASLQFQVNLNSRVTGAATAAPSYCLPAVVATSGRRSLTLGAGWSSNTKEMSFALSLPPGAPRLKPPFGRMAISTLGVIDPAVRLTVHASHRVEAIELDKNADAVSFYARIARPGRNRDGAELNMTLDLVQESLRRYGVVSSPSSLSFDIVPGGRAVATIRLDAVDSNCAVATAPWRLAAPVPSWMSVRTLGGTLLPGNVQVVADAGTLAPGTYMQTLQIEVPEATNKTVTVDAILRIRPSAN